MIAPGMMPASEVPSLGAMAWMYCAALALPAPGMFFTTMVGLSGDVAAEMPRHRARVDVVAAAGRRADQKLDGLAGVVVVGQ